MYITENVNKKYCYASQITYNKTNKQYHTTGKCIGQLHNNTLIPNKYLTQLLTQQQQNPQTLTNHEKLTLKTITNKYGPNIKQPTTTTTTLTTKNLKQTLQTAQALFIGPKLVFGTITKHYNLNQILTESFNPNTAQDILSLAWYLAAEGNALSDSDSWLNYYQTPRNTPITSQDITRLLDNIDYDGMMTFYKLWLKETTKHTTTKKQDKTLYDLTSISYYGTNINTAQYGYNRNHENLPQVNYALLCLRSTAMPLFAWPLNGNITDINTLQTLLEFLKKFEFTPDCLMLDRGFSSINNLCGLFEKGYTFLQALRVNAKWIYDVIDATENLRATPDAQLKVDKRTYYVSSSVCWWVRTRRVSGKNVGKEEVVVHLCRDGSLEDRYVNLDVGVEVVGQYLCWVHVLFCADLVGNWFDRFMGRLKAEHDRLVGDDDAEVSFEFAKFLRVTKVGGVGGGRLVEYVSEEIVLHKDRYGGFVCFLTNDSSVSTAEVALGEYSTRDYIEKDFDELKNDLDMVRIRVHSDVRLRARLFVSFVAEIFMREVRVCLRDSKSCSKLSRKQIFSHIKTIYKVRFKGGEEIFPELSRQQRDILEALKIDIRD